MQVDSSRCNLHTGEYVPKLSSNPLSSRPLLAHSHARRSPQRSTLFNPDTTKPTTTTTTTSTTGTLKHHLYSNLSTQPTRVTLPSGPDNNKLSINSGTAGILNTPSIYQETTPPTTSHIPPFHDLSCQPHCRTHTTHSDWQSQWSFSNPPSHLPSLKARHSPTASGNESIAITRFGH